MRKWQRVAGYHFLIDTSYRSYEIVPISPKTFTKDPFIQTTEITIFLFPPSFNDPFVLDHWLLTERIKKMGNNVRNKKMNKGEKETFDPFVIYILDVQLLIRANGGRWLSTKSRNNSNYLQSRATFSNRFELRAATRFNEINRYHPFHFDQLFEFLPSNQRSKLFFFRTLYVKWIFFGIMVGKFFLAPMTQHFLRLPNIYEISIGF